MNEVITPKLITALYDGFRLGPNSEHGPAHWMRVRKNGLLLAELTGANTRVLELFSVFHDSCRVSEYDDPEHGPRAAELALKYFHRGMLNCNEDEIELLTRACIGHTHEHSNPNITISTCWDADRLDLPRCGITVDPNRLATQQARQHEIIKAAESRAESWLKKKMILESEFDVWELSEPRKSDKQCSNS
jgi:uncharacterized protein